MDAIEKAIRNAFEKGDAQDRAYREKVYRSAFGALDRALQANPSTTVEVAIKRRKALSAKISEIETEFIPAVAAPAPAGNGAVELLEDELRSRGQSRGERPQRREADFAPQIDPRDRAEHQPRAAGSKIAEPVNGRAKGERRRGRKFGLVLIVVTLVSALAIGLWFAADTGQFQTQQARDTSVPNPPASFQDDDFLPDAPQTSTPPRLPGQAADLSDWIVVFDPSDPTLVAAPSDATADVFEDDGETYVRVRSGQSGAAVMFDVGQGILEQLSGRRAVFAVVARAEEDQETQISIDCNFGELGDCGRRRYLVGITREEFLFEIDLPAIRPGAGGTIAINSDITGSGRAIDIFEIRVSPEG